MNNQIRVPEIRCIDENGEQMGIIPTRQALVRAHEAKLDLIEARLEESTTQTEIRHLLGPTERGL